MRRPWLLLPLFACSPKPAAPEVPVEVASARVMPEPLEVPEWSFPEASSGALSNGIEVLVVENHEVPLVDVRVVFETGTWLDPVGAEGLTNVTVDMLDEGTEEHTAAELTRALATLGSSLSVAAAAESVSLSATTLVRNLDATSALAAEVLRTPTLPDDELTRMVERKKAAVRRSAANPSTIAAQVFGKLLYGDSFRGRITTEETLDAIDPAAVSAQLDQVVRPDAARILVGGDTTLEEILPLLESHFGDWVAPETPLATQPEPPRAPAADPGLYFVHSPGATQSVLRVGQFAPGREHEAYFPLWLANEVLGGSFTARVNMNLREDKSWTYGARCSYLTARQGPALWRCATQVRADATGGSLTELSKEITEVRTTRPPTAEEVDTFKQGALLARPRSYETPRQLLDDTIDELRYGLPSDWHETWSDKVSALTVEQAVTAAETWIQPDQLIWLVVGDREVLGEQLDVLGMPITELDTTGAVVE